jgi:hypothetical protein
MTEHAEALSRANAEGSGEQDSSQAVSVPHFTKSTANVPAVNAQPFRTLGELAARIVARQIANGGAE